MAEVTPLHTTPVNPGRRPLILLAIPFALVTLGTLGVYFLADQTLEALRRSMEFSDIWMEADRSALLQLERCVDLGGGECDLVSERLKRPLAYLRATQERAKSEPDATVMAESLKEAGLDASPLRFRLRWFDRVSQWAGLPLRNLEPASAQNKRLRGEMPQDLETLFSFNRRAREAWARTPPDAANLAAVKQGVEAFGAGLEKAKARFDANAHAASDRLRRMLYALVGGSVVMMFGVASWIFQRMIQRWQKAEESFRERDRRLSQELSERVEQLQVALGDKNVLLQEVQHRVKNNLAVISALLTLEAGQAESAQAEPVLLRTRDRIHSMALVHERLCHEGTAAEIDFGEYVETLGRDLMASFGAEGRGIQLHTSIEARLGLIEAVPCGLIVNELLTNALKHAFPNGRGGSIWFSMSEQEDGRTDLDIRDDGVGLPADFDLAVSRSLGMQIVNDLTEQLGGTLQRESGAGTRFHICFERRPRVLSVSNSQ